MFNQNSILYVRENDETRATTLKNISEKWVNGDKTNIQAITFSEPENVTETGIIKLEKKDVNLIHKDFYRLTTSGGFKIILMESNDIFIQCLDSNKPNPSKEKYYLNIDLILDYFNSKKPVYLTLKRPEFGKIDTKSLKYQTNIKTGIKLAFFFSSFSTLNLKNPILKVRFKRDLLKSIKEKFFSDFSSSEMIKNVYGSEIFNDLKSYSENALLNGKYSLMNYIVSEKSDIFLTDFEQIFFPLKKYYNEDVNFGGSEDEIFDTHVRNFLITGFPYETLKSFIHYLFLIEGENFDLDLPIIKSKNPLFLKTINDIAFMVGYDSIYDEEKDMVFISEKPLGKYDVLKKIEKISSEDLKNKNLDLIDFQSPERKILMNQFIIMNDYRN